MAKKIYRTAQGKVVDFDSIYLTNEETIAVGNMRVNARGDELGPGGKIVKTRAQVMEEYYKLSSPTSQDAPVADAQPAPVATPTSTPQIHPDHIAKALTEEMPADVAAQAAEFDEGSEDLPAPVGIMPTTRGSLATAVAATATVTQTPQLPLNKRNGVQRF